MENELIRLNKYLAGSGICSRREADRMIEEGRVSIENEDGTVRKADIGERIREGAAVFVDGKPVRNDENEKLYMMINKPKGIICTGDRRVRENIIDFAGLRHYIFCGAPALYILRRAARQRFDRSGPSYERRRSER